MGFRVKTTPLRGLEFNCVEWGGGGSPPVVLLHGLTGHARTWDRFANALKDEYRLFALDQRGHGDTSWPDPPRYRTGDFVEDVRTLAGAWGIERFALIGLSMGAHNALAFAAQYPDMVDKLVPVDIGPSHRRMDEDEMRVGRAWLDRRFATLEDAIAESLAMNPVADPEMIRNRVRHNMSRSKSGGWEPKHSPDVDAYWRPDDLSEAIAEIRCPTLVVRGGDSHALSPEMAEWMASTIPDCRLATIEGSGHSVPQDKPDLFEAAVREFLES